MDAALFVESGGTADGAEPDFATIAQRNTAFHDPQQHLRA
jgi:hypothetical protein